MRELEARFDKELVVIGVLSGKYHAERVTSRIRDASIRLDAIHPVINDRQFRIWRSYAVSAWPTIVAVDPGGYVVGAHAGEFTAEMLVPFIEGLIESARTKGALNDVPFRPPSDMPTLPTGILAYPGKIAVSGKRIAIADSGHHRILVGVISEKPGVIHLTKTIGDGRPGFVDGAEPRFRSPQGVLFAGDRLYVADSENHSIRAIDLQSGKVATIAGIGRQLRTHGDRDAGAMSSPWDIAVAGDVLFVAMAGIHQIWSVDLKTGQSRVHAGSGAEEIRDGDNSSALLAQPMGITVMGDDLYFADAESNGIRRSGTSRDGSVTTIVGTGLFDFGDVDGAGDEVRLQHPQGITVSPNGDLLVADSYNDCLKFVSPIERTSRAWVRGLSEPSGVACSETHAYVADTNAHRVVAIDFATASVSAVTIE